MVTISFLIFIFNFLKTFSFEKFTLIFKFLLSAYLLSKFITTSITFVSAQIVPLIPSLAKINKPERSFSFSISNNLFLRSRINFSWRVFSYMLKLRIFKSNFELFVNK